jgi:hypothetical protein
MEDDAKLQKYFQKQSDDDLKPHLYHFVLDKWRASEAENMKLNPEDELQKCSIRPFGRWFEYHFSKKKSIHGIWYHGIFAATRERIHRYPLQLYQHLIKDMNHHSNPEAGHYMERSWFALIGDD